VGTFRYNLIIPFAYLHLQWWLLQCDLPEAATSAALSQRLAHPDHRCSRILSWRTPHQLTPRRLGHPCLASTHQSELEYSSMPIVYRCSMHHVSQWQLTGEDLNIPEDDVNYNINHMVIPVVFIISVEPKRPTGQLPMTNIIITIIPLSMWRLKHWNQAVLKLITAY